MKTKFSLRDSSRLLATCSNSVVKCPPAKLFDSTKKCQVLQVLQKRFNSVIDLAQKLAFAPKKNKFREPVRFDNSMQFFLLKNFEDGFNILTETAISIRGGSSASRDHTVIYSIFLHRKA